MQFIFLFFFLIYLSFSSFNCQSQKKFLSCGIVKSVIGSVYGNLPSQKPKIISNSQQIFLSETITVTKSSRCIIETAQEQTIHVSENSQIICDTILYNNITKAFPRLIYGEAFANSLDRFAIQFSSFNVFIEPNIEKTKFWVKYNKNSEEAIIACLSGVVQIMISSGSQTQLPSCYKVLINKSGIASDIITTTSKDYQKIASSAGFSLDTFEQISFCNEAQLTINNINKPPVWKKPLSNVCYLDQKFVDTIIAEDPEGGFVNYKLIEHPEGMKIDKNSGIIYYNPKKCGTFSVQILAFDSLNLQSSISCLLTVIKEDKIALKTKKVKNVLPQPSIAETIKQTPDEIKNVENQKEYRSKLPVNVILNFPYLKEPNDTVEINACGSYDASDSMAKLLFRFDVNSDNVWDYPTSGFSQECLIRHVFNKEGIYSITCEAKSNDLRIGKAQGKIFIRINPQANIEIKPTICGFGEICTLDASKSIVSSLDKQLFLARWDLNNDGIWDFPSNGNFGEAKSVLKKLEGNPPFMVALQIKDSYGLTSKAIAEIPVKKTEKEKKLEFKIISLFVPETLIAERPFNIICKTSLPESDVLEYEWDFDNDGTFEIKNDKSNQTYTFPKEGKYNISCSVKSINGEKAKAVKSVLVLNKNVKIKINIEPQNVQILEPVTFNADIKASNTKISKISWDFDGNNSWDYSSQNTPQTKFSYPKVGIYHPVIRIITDNKYDWYDTGVVTVYEPLQPKAIAGKNIYSNKNETVVLNGEGIAPKGKIILYEWDFNGDGIFDWSSKKSGKTSYKYSEYSKAILKVTSDNGLSAFDTVTIVICPQDMIGVKEGPFCIDKYEYPNKKGQIPTTDINLKTAEQICLKEGKRLCTSQEWELACRGFSKREYPVSTSQYATQPCNVLDKKESPNHIMQSGAMSDCKSYYGAYDMNGNVAEWVYDKNNNNTSLAYGGSWMLPQENAKCLSKLSLRGDRGYPYVGFRCCK